MIRNTIHALNDWYNTRSRGMQKSALAAFCIVFLLFIWGALTYIRFNPQVYTTEVLPNIGRSSGLQFTDSLTTKKH